ncbi:hypothetical protein INT48_007129 [Thamnidium elegans]|uniref:Uncharacterized protein n=1 Tax=Thamnidium elegans TaxID=101142 RepID=A0A8H7W0J6_9FUNG|nr:hypothetical protein INT48_007129 [Thamnidium elegans]
MRQYAALSIATLFIFPLFVLTIPVQDEGLSLNPEFALTSNSSVCSLNATTTTCKGINNSSEDGLSPKLLQFLLHTIDVLIKTYPDEYGKDSVLEHNVIPTSVAKYFPAISPRQLNQIESTVETLIKKYQASHYMASTFYHRPRIAVIQKRYNRKNDYAFENEEYNCDKDNSNQGGCPEQRFPETPLQPDPWDPTYAFQFEAHMDEMNDFFVRKQDQIITMPDTYIPDFSAKLIKNFGSINDQQHKKIKERIDSNLKKYRNTSCGSTREKRDVILIPPEKYVASLYEKSLDSLENYFIENKARIQDSSLSDIQALREKLVAENTKNFCYLQRRTYESIFDTLLYRIRPTKVTADKALVNIIRFMENNKDRYNGISADSVDFISISLKTTIPNEVTTEQRQELIQIIENALKTFYSTATASEPEDQRDPQLANKFRSRIFSRDEALENVFNTHIQKLYNKANDKMNDIRNANTLDEIAQIRAEIVNSAGKDNNNEYTHSVSKVYLDSFIASIRPFDYATDNLAFEVYDYFNENGKAFAGLSKEDDYESRNKLQEKLPIDGTDKEREDIRQYIESESSKAKSFYS